MQRFIECLSICGFNKLTRVTLFIQKTYYLKDMKKVIQTFLLIYSILATLFLVFVFYKNESSIKVFD